jgi:hypothetical protein
MGIYRGAGGTSDAVNDASSEAVLVQQLAVEAQADADAAAASATAAAGSASTASTAASNALTAETNAETAETNAETAETNAETAQAAAEAAQVAAETAQTAAELAETNAETAETNAETAQAAAASSASAASSSASTASTQATNASNSASAASTSATNASNSASAASTSASNASTSATAAASSASAASTSASNASTSATNAANSATSASTSATTATTQAGIATTQATNAASSASAASTSATNAASSATSASGSATTATTQATAAGTSATNAAASASTATTQATNAASSATAAAGSATSASASAAAASAVALGNEPVRHSVRPSLLLDFANTKTLDPRITFTRASTATFYDGKTTAIAEQNLLLYSQIIGSTGWTLGASATATANNTTAPDGTTTASTITSTSSVASNTGTYETISTAIGHTFSVYAKAGTATFLGLTNNVSGSSYANFNLSTGAVASSAGCTASITSVGSGWYRCVMANTTATGIYFMLLAKDADPAGNPWATGTCASGNTINLWGAQLEQRSSVTAYTATTTAPITNYIPALQSAASGVARFEHNPTTGESLGLLIEEQRTNLVLRSDDFANAAWTSGSQTVSSNVAIAPDGTLTAEKLIANTGTIYQSVTIANSTNYTWSIYAKAGEKSWLRLLAQDTVTLLSAYFNLATGTIGTVGSGATATITAVGNGWYRCTISKTSASTSGFFNFGVVDGDNTTVSTGNGFSGIYIWGAQLEAGAFATSYIPTVASQVTRSFDSAGMTGTNFSSWYRADEGTVYSEASIRPEITSSNRYSWSLGFTAGSSDATFLTAPYGGTNRYRLLGFIGSTSSIDIFPATVYSNNTINKSGFAYKANDFALSVNAETPTTDTSGSMSPAIDRLFIGSSTASTAHLNGTIKKLAYYPKRLTNAELQGVTTV